MLICCYECVQILLTFDRYHIDIYNNIQRGFWGAFFILPIIPLNKLAYKNVILLGSLKKMRIYILFAILQMSLKKISMVCYNLKMTNVYTYDFNQNFIKKTLHSLHVLAPYNINMLLQCKCYQLH